MKRLLILNVVGLTSSLLKNGAMPRLEAFATLHGLKEWNPGLPAVTASVQADLLTDARPAQHGIVGNGWYDRDYGEVRMWPQSANLLQGDTIHEKWRQAHPGSQTAQLFWWWNLPSRADISVTPRPTYWADGRKGPDIHSNPSKVRNRLIQRYGDFPLFNFWGPAAGIQSTRWIVDATLDVLKEERPGLCLSYLPHLDYDLQRFGPDSLEARRACKEVDNQAGRLLDYANGNGIDVVVLSEYGIEAVSQAAFLNRCLRREGFLKIHPARNGSLLDPGNSRAFAVCDHQCAHVYVSKETDLPLVKELLSHQDGVEKVLDKKEQSGLGLNHPRSGELFCIAKEGWWFAYPYWLEDEPEPDFARTVNIHKKPGFDPCELFLDNSIPLVKARIAFKLLAKKLGFRAPMPYISQNTSLPKGSHGRTSTALILNPTLFTDKK
ncbi:MAG: alkaline phosphatase family protein [Planctomycetota bacterium]|nr:alkaline phosphatase family protein [Planctomycetota bacterium]MDP6941077.1 alkaline phosphatase family protein [Planctomycetota bacterium]